MSVDRGTVDITIYYADDDTEWLIFSSEDENGNTVPHDLTFYDDIIMAAKPFVNYEGEPVVKWTLGDGLAIRGGEDTNILEVSLNWPRIKPLQGGQEYPFDIRFLIRDELKTLLEGTICSDESVTMR
jgi:hypothetical protein